MAAPSFPERARTGGLARFLREARPSDEHAGLQEAQEPNRV
jgi:hypothetical protein